MNKALPIGFGVAGALAFWPGIIDPANAPKFAVVSLGLPLLLTRAPKLTPVGLLLGAWLLVSLWALWWTPALADGIRELWFLVLFLMAFTIGQRGGAQPILLGLAWGTLVSVILAVPQSQDLLHAIPQAMSPAGLFSNKDFLGEASALLGLWAWLTGRKKLALMLFLGPLITHSRAGIVGLALVGAYWFWRKDKWWALGIGFGGAFAAWNFFSHNSLSERWNIWIPTVENLNWSGHGTGSFSQLFPSINQSFDLLAERPDLPHNELLNLVFTLGAWAIFPVGAYLFVYYWAPQREKYLLVAASVPLFFNFPLHLPISLLVLGLITGSADRNGINVVHWFAYRRARARLGMASRAGLADSRGAQIG